MILLPTFTRVKNALADFFVRPHYPGEVIEILQDRCTAISVQRKNGRIRIRSAAVSDLPRGAVQPHFSQKNMVDETPVVDTCADAMKKAGIEPGAVTLLIPEGCVKVTIIDDFESLPRESEYVRELILQKLRKTLPFPTQEAVLSWQVLRKTPKPLVVTMIVHTGILAQYLTIAERLGCHAGCVDIPSFNLLPVVHATGVPLGAGGSVLLVNVDRNYLSQALIAHGDMILFRTKARSFVETNGASKPLLHGMVEEVLTTARYYEDKISGGQPVGLLLVRETGGHLNELCQRIGTDTRSEVRAMGIQDILAADAETPSPVMTQMLLPLIGAALR
ncbi:MAG: hypothetical protein AB1714_29230 [Acidobacteriota bacterium]